MNLASHNGCLIHYRYNISKDASGARTSLAHKSSCPSSAARRYRDRPRGCAGSGGTIVARFVNQTAQVVANAGIGAFPRRSVGGAGGDANCLGGEQCITTQLLVCLN